MERLSIIVPYRNRKPHLKEFIPHMEKTDQLDGIDYEILIIEQRDEKPFNRGKLLNIGVSLCLEESSYFCFHDVDMLPTKCDYSPCVNPTHLASQVQQFDWKLPYDKYFGGVTLFDKKSFVIINGFNNDYWGWGAEDDDLRFRCESSGISIDRRDGKFLSLNHDKNVNSELYNNNLEKYRELKSSKSSEEAVRIINANGLNSLEYEKITEERISQRTRKILVRI
jgi:predicted glycosyltransferase involved in capsule biosynthesis